MMFTISGRHFAFLILCHLSILATNTAAAGEEDNGDWFQRRKPNVILFNADDMGWGDISSYGHPTQEWGPIDDMAREGMRFTNHYSPASICTPSRSGLMTGKTVNIYTNKI